MAHWQLMQYSSPILCVLVCAVLIIFINSCFLSNNSLYHIVTSLRNTSGNIDSDTISGGTKELDESSSEND